VLTPAQTTEFPRLASVDAPIARLEELRGELAKTWLLRTVEQLSLDELERLPTARIARELPGLIAEIARAAGEVSDNDDPAAAAVDPRARHIDWAKQLAELSGREQLLGPHLIRDIAGLQSVMIMSLHRQLRTLDPVSTLRAVEDLTELFSAMQADAVEEVMRQRSRELEWLGTTDALTGLHNERYLRQHLGHLLGMQKRYGHPFALLLVDVDGLGRINDAYGSAAGDRTLVDVATALGETIRAVDTPIRLGGDEFCVLLPNQTAMRARALAERIAEAVRSVDSPGGGPLAVAIGVVSAPQHGTDADRLLELADGAMYRAKAAGERVAVGVESGEQAGATTGDDAE
jgi:diguanylate cyclase (GGDEF)-like protein